MNFPSPSSPCFLFGRTSDIAAGRPDAAANGRNSQIRMLPVDGWTWHCLSKARLFSNKATLPASAAGPSMEVAELSSYPPMGRYEGPQCEATAVVRQGNP
jgi:hypothetical protein